MVKKQKQLVVGNCQVSTTIYNVAVKTPDVEIIERHEHSRKVPYIADGLDAAVSHGSLDLKFKNTGNQRLKLTVEVTEEEVLAVMYSI